MSTTFPALAPLRVPIPAAETDRSGPVASAAEWRRRAAVSLAISAFLHLNILFGLAAVYHVAATHGAVLWIETVVASPSPEAVVTQIEDDFSVQPDADQELAAAWAVPSALMSQEPTALDQTMEEVAASILADGEGGGDPDGEAAAAGPAEGRAQSGSGKVGFFGTEGHGKRFVFVVDCSKSMRGDRFARARHELSRSLQHLGEDEEFFIYFFSDRAIPMFDPRPANEPVLATTLAIGKARRWIVNRGAFGNTFPDEALRLALRMKPDVVFFLTDGEFSPSARETCRRENQSGTAIHTIAFGTRLGETQLKAIAEENRGRYRFVP